MTKERLVTAPKRTDLKKAEKILQKYKIEKLPVVSSNGKLIGLITYRDIIQIQSFPNAAKDEFGRLRVGAALGTQWICLIGTAALQQNGVDVVCPRQCTWPY
jgi:IMP dehydrogenase